MNRQLMLSLRRLHKEVNDAYDGWTFSTNNDSTLVGSTEGFYLAIGLNADVVYITSFDAQRRRMLLEENYSHAQWPQARQRFLLLLDGLLLAVAMEDRL